MILIAVYGLILGSVVINPVLPALGLPSVTSFPKARHVLPQTARSRAQHYRARSYQQAKAALAQFMTDHPAKKAELAPAPKSDKVIGFFVNWDDTSFTSLKQNLGSMTTLTPEWLHLGSTPGTLVLDNPDRQTEVTDYVRARKSNLEIMPLINNFSQTKADWDEQAISDLLHNQAAETHLIDQMKSYVTTHGYQGISIDFESVASKDGPALVDFVRQLTTNFHAAGLEVSQNVPMADDAFDYQDLANNADYLILMAYDENASNDLPGPVASQQWFTDKLKDRLQDIPANKLIVALGNYGYDWIDGKTNGRGISFQEAMTTAHDSEGQVEFDSDTLNPTYDYVDEHNTTHRVWFLDGVTAFNQLAAVESAHAAGIALWRLGSEDPTFWSAVDNRQDLTSVSTEQLKSLRYGYDIDYEGSGEILKVAHTPVVGRRELTFDQSQQLITNETVPELPQPYTINRWGGGSEVGKKIALTFDDGPDGVYTPQILKILAERNVHATFFVVGTNGEAHSSILGQIIHQGNEIGNHTYTHPNIAVVPPEQLTLELNADERLFESVLGRRSVLFRPPYSEDVEPNTPDEVLPLVTTSKLGYYTIGMQIDPSDWKNPGKDAIVQAVLTQADHGQGHIVLLHDSGGDRTQTVAALPQIIDGLKARGYQLVTISNLLGLSTNQVMPPVVASSRFVARTNNVGFVLASWLIALLHWVALIAIFLSIVRLVTLSILAFLQSRQPKRGVTHDLPSIAVLVPAYNEGRVIGQTLESLLRLDYPELSILVINDGSTDDTAAIVSAMHAKYPTVRLLSQTNQGKAAALNAGIATTKADVLVIIDADTQVKPDSLRFLAQHFADPMVGAVAGNAKVGNRMNILTRWQALEYITSQNLERRALNRLNSITVVPGAIGAWRRQLVERVGLFSDDTLAEDADLTIRMLRAGYRVEYESRAIAWTEAPDTFQGLIKQRYRWAYGIMQSAWKHRATFLRRQFGNLGFFGIPTLWLFQIILPLISPAIDLLMILAIGWTVLQMRAHPDHHSIDGLKHIAFLYALFLLVDYLAAIVAFSFERREDWSLIISLFFQRLVYRILMYYVLVKAALAALRGHTMAWTHIDRKATVVDRAD